jgi:hypothetical protein
VNQGPMRFWREDVIEYSTMIWVFGVRVFKNEEGNWNYEIKTIKGDLYAEDEFKPGWRTAKEAAGQALKLLHGVGKHTMGAAENGLKDLGMEPPHE